MANLLKISEAASLALHSLVLMGSDPLEPLTTNRIASLLGVSEAHLSKVLQRLAREGFVKSMRGPKGGFVLAKPGTSITLLEVYESIEGPVSWNDCLLDAPICGGKCIFGGLLAEVNRRVKTYLAETTLDQLSDVKGCLYAGATKDSQD